MQPEDAPTVEIADFYPLTPLQQGMLFHSLESPAAGMYFNQICCPLEGTLDTAALGRAWQHVVERHPILRTAFVWEDLDEPLQVVCQGVRLPIRHEDWRAYDAAEQQERLANFLLADRVRGFDLTAAPLLRLALLRLGETRYQWIWSHHHLLLDGWSVPLLLQEVFALYRAFTLGEAAQLPARRPFADYVEWLRTRDLTEAEAFWRRKLVGFTAPTPLHWAQRSTTQPPSALSAGQDYAQQEITLSAELTAQLETLARTQRLTLNTLVQGAWALLLSCCSGTTDIVFGTTFSGRPLELPGAETMIGLFINTLPLRVDVNPAAELLPWLHELQAQLLEMRRYEFCPPVKLQDWSEVPRPLPLFESLLGFENHPVVQAGGGRAASGPAVQVVERTNYPLTVKALPGRELTLQALYDGRRFESAALTRLLSHWRNLLEEFAAQPQRRLAAFSPLSSAERAALLVEFNQTAQPAPPPDFVLQRFAAQVAQTPEAIAVRSDNEVWTYAELDARANQLACALRQRNLNLKPGAEAIVGLCLPRTPELLAGLLGILKAGAAFLPLAGALPPARLAALLNDAGARLVLTNADWQARLPQGAWEVLRLDELKPNEAAGATPSALIQTPEIQPEQLAYVLYTSGSTGQPKGVMVSQRGLANYLAWALAAYAVADGSGAPVHSPLSFDLTLTGVLPPLLAGRTVTLVSEEAGVAGLAAALRARRSYSLVKLTPAHLEVLRQLLRDEELAGLTARLVIGGEALLGEALAPWLMHAPATQLVNEYGPTETVVGCCVYTATAADARGPIPIGQPIANTQLYVLDSAGRPVPAGVAGELFIGGAGVARGYLNRPAATAERFVPDPFSATLGARLYRTGDLVRLSVSAHAPLSAGQLIFLGRADQQVKLRGFRIELGEIEAALAAHPAVRECAVSVVNGATGEAQLVAFVVAETSAAHAVAPATAAAASELRAFLAERLPDYMVPMTFVALPALPLNARGKVDRPRLAALVPDAGATVGAAPSGGKAAYVAPRDALEAALVELWENVLQVRPLSVTGNFFELGGHSLLAVRLMAQVQKRFGQELPLNSLIRAATVAEMATLIRAQTGPLDWSPIVELQPHGNRPPFFCVHPVGGNILRYRELAQYLGADQPFYGLEAPGLGDDRNHYVLIENLAAYYLRAVRERQPTGPYLLGGHSFGGFVAFEMAQQLRRQGETVALLALLDTPAPSYIVKPPDNATLLAGRVREIGREAGVELDLTPAELAPFPLPEQIEYILRWLKERNFLTEDMDPQWIARYLDGLRARERAVLGYKPHYCQGALTLIRAREQDPDTLAYYAEQGLDHTDPALGWNQLAETPIEVHFVPGLHDTMMFEPNVRVLAARLRQCLDEALAQRSSAHG